ncbi:MAG: hypothetical protein AB1601_00595 [Planctomycetota bacterium]
MLLHCLDAKVHHLAVGGARLPQYVVTALGAMNPVALHVLYSTDIRRSRRRLLLLLCRRLVIELVKDLYYHDWRVPRARGIVIAVRASGDVLARSKEDLAAYYPELQRRILFDGT